MTKHSNVKPAAAGLEAWIASETLSGVACSAWLAINSTTMETKTYKGLLCAHSWGEADDLLFLSSLEDPIAEVLKNDIARKTVSARYWVTDKEATKEQAQEDFVKKLMGVADCHFGSRYSEITGYLWTDEKCKIGGHDLISELRSHVGKWLILEVDVHGG